MTTMIPIPIAYLYTAQGISGSIRFQKLVFLGQKETGLPDHYKFIPYEFGPYSYQLERDIEHCIDQEYVKRNRVQNQAGNNRIDYTLTPEGLRLAKSLIDNNYEEIFDKVQEIVSDHGSKELSRLLKYVYNKYSDYTDESTLDVERLFDESVSSQFIEQDESQVGPFSHIRRLDEEEGELAGGNGEFTRQQIEVGTQFQATLERINNDGVSIYWRSSESAFDAFVEAIKEDSAVSEDAYGELQTQERQIEGSFGELLNEIEPKSEPPQFLLVRTDNSEYLASWEAGRAQEGDEITIYATGEEINYEELRRALTLYATQTALAADLALGSQIDTTDSKITEGLRQTAKLAVS